MAPLVVFGGIIIIAIGGLTLGFMNYCSAPPGT